jgi:hypothetical protein
MPTAFFGRYSVSPCDGLYVVVDRFSEEPVTMDDGKPAIFAHPREAFHWIIFHLRLAEKQ